MMNWFKDLIAAYAHYRCLRGRHAWVNGGWDVSFPVLDLTDAVLTWVNGREVKCARPGCKERGFVLAQFPKTVLTVEEFNRFKRGLQESLLAKHGATYEFGTSNRDSNA